MALREVSLWGLSLKSGTYEEATQALVSLAKEPGFKRVVTFNPEIWVQSQADPLLWKLIQDSDFVTLDGVGTSLAARWLWGRLWKGLPG